MGLPNSWKIILLVLPAIALLATSIMLSQEYHKDDEITSGSAHKDSPIPGKKTVKTVIARDEDAAATNISIVDEQDFEGEDDGENNAAY